MSNTTANGRRLRIRRRPESVQHNNWTLFARLDENLALDLVRQALNEVGDPQQQQQQQRRAKGWSLEPPSTTNAAVEFLPLCLILSDASEIYVSYNGGSVSKDRTNADDNDDAIELPESLVPETESYITAKPLLFVSDAQSIHVEPLTVSDWELLEIHADWLERGGLLSQVSVVYEHQVLCFCVGRNNNDWVRVQVVKVNNEDEEKCVRLMADTEVIVVPKPRQTQSSGSRISPPLRVLPTKQDYSFRMRNLAESMEVELLHVPFGTAYVNNETIEECNWEKRRAVVRLFRSKKREDEPANSDIAIARVESNNQVPMGHIVMNSLVRTQLHVSALFDYVQLELLDEDVSVSAQMTKEMVNKGLLKVSLRPVYLIDSPMDSSTPWQYPFASFASRGKHNHLGDAARRDSRQRHADLLARIKSWLDCSDELRDVPLLSGSLLDLSCAEDECVYELVVDTTDEAPLAELTLLAGDLLSLLPKSSTSRSSRSSVISVVETARYDYLLNLLPETPEVSLQNSKALRTELCFDGFVVHGDRGSGKTHTALMLAARERIRDNRGTVYMDSRRLQSSSDLRMKDTLAALTDVFTVAAGAAPCILILDDLDELAPNLEFEDGDEEGSAQQQQPNPTALSQSKLIADLIRNLIEEYSRDVFVVITCREEESLAPSIQSSSVFLKSEPVASVVAGDREALFSSMLRHKLQSDHFKEIGTSGFARKTEGYCPFDLDILASRVRHSILADGGDVADVTRIVEDALESYIPLSRQGIRVQSSSIEATWEQIGGLFRVKEQLTATILNPVKYSRIYQSSPVRLPRGMLLLGPPGCGKSYLVPALARKCGLTLITCRGPELLDKYIGASEAKVRQLFQRAYTAAPSLLFLDEFDALAPRRGSDHTGVTDRVVNQLLTFLDGVEVESDKQVYIVGATSRPDKVDPALLRPGRLEQHIFVGFPENHAEWNDVLLKILVDQNVEPEVMESIPTGRLLTSVKATAPHVQYFSPADLRAVVNTAHLQAVHELIAQKETIGAESAAVTIRHSHIESSMQSTKPSLSPADRSMLDNIYRPFQGSERGFSEPETMHSAANNLRTALR